MTNRFSLSYFILAAGFVLAYVAILVWFDRVGFYQNYFFESGLPVTLYQGARLVFACFLAWLIYATGAGLATAVCGRAIVRSLPAWERVPLLFIIGAGSSHLVLFGLGLAGLIIKPVIVVLTLGVMAASLPHLAACLQKVSEKLPKVARRLLQLRAIPLLILIVATVVASTMFIAAKGLYPAGGHDYYNHYFYYYKRVVDIGSILPNDVWYHFFYSKGAGLYFLSMLLTDALAPQLVTSAFIACGAAIVWALLKRASDNSLLPWIGVFLYVVFLIYTPGPIENMRHGGWGDLEKIHELTSVLCLAVVWIAYRVAHEPGRTTRIWGLGLQSAIIGIAVLTPVLVLVIGGLLSLYFLYLCARGSRESALWVFAGCASGGMCLLATAAINYHLTGIALDQLLVHLWPYVDLQRVARWGALLEVLSLHSGLTGLHNQTAPWSWNVIPLFATFLRLELWWPIMLAALPLIAFQLGSPPGRQALLRRFDPHLWVALGGFAIMAVLVALFGGGRSQYISFYRLSSFSYASTLCAALALWGLALGAKEFRRRRLEAGLAIVLAAAIPAWVAASTLSLPHVRWYYGNFLSIMTNADQLIMGKFSLKEAYQNQQSWPGRMKWGGIYPGVVTPWRMLPPKTPIWSFHISSYCMLPGCEMRSDTSFRISPSWQTVFFGSPEEAKSKLQEEGLNYFFYSSELGTDDLILAAPLFSPDRIAEQLAIRWTDGTSYLLTWKDATTEPLTLEFLAAFRKSFNESSRSHWFLSAEWKWREISDYIASHSDNLKPFNLPWCTNCQGMQPAYGSSQ